MDDGLPGAHQDLLHEGPHEGTCFRDLAGAQELAHVLGEGGDDIGAVQQLAALGQHGPRLPGGDLQLLLPLLVLLDAVGGVGEVEVGALHEAPDAVQFLALLDEFLLDALEPLALLVGDAVHLLVEHPHQFSDVGFREDVVA